MPLFERTAIDGDLHTPHRSLRRTMFLLGAGVGSLACFVAAIIDWHSGLITSLPQDLLLGTALIPIFFWAWRTADATVPARVGMLIFSLSFLPSIPEELRLMPTFLLWLPAIPMLAFYFFGFREGLIWAGTFAGIIATEVLWLIAGGTPPLFSPMLIMAAISYLLLSSVAGAFQYLIEVYETARIRDIEMREAVQTQVAEMQKLESIGLLAGGIAHDFNNLLVGVMGNAELAMLDTPKQSSSHPHLKQIFKSARRGAELVDQMLAYSGQGKIEITPIQLNRLADEITTLLATVIARRATITKDLSPDLPAFEGDRNQISQVIMNLLTNATESITDTPGEIRLQSGVRRLAPSDLERMVATDRSEAGEFVYLQVQDNGCGMDNETEKRIFDPFFTTKESGTGLGLAALLGIIRSHHGALQLTSAPGSGTTFTVFFPVATSAG